MNRWYNWAVPFRVDKSWAAVAAGSLRIRYYRLVLAIVLSSIVYDGTLITLGALAGIGLKDVEPEYSAWIVIGFVAVMTVVFAIVHLIRRRFKWS